MYYPAPFLSSILPRFLHALSRFCRDFCRKCRLSSVIVPVTIFSKLYEVFFMTALSPRRTFSGTALKTIACITMLVEHIGASCIEAGILTPGLDAGTLSQDTLSAYPL